ncbi:fruit-body specific protein a [Moniliophthora roreri MCA 2997]|uniref:Fruit-body specific protein a n=1 Tax=Moniliophthora roreri (strain MCA 2997) TaxID=1381753 RepID=V2Y742_MONRO|nr:fruit-body specific protein a [Moniliophthora roreri MCA 2997]
MKLLSALVAVLTVSCASAAITVRFPKLKRDGTSTLSLSEANHYGSPAPFVPGWYYGNTPSLAPDLPWLKDKVGFFFFRLSFVFPKPNTRLTEPLRQDTTNPQPSQVPPPPSGVYTPTFTGLTGAIQADDYITFGLVDTVQDCEQMCDGVSGCAFFNTYHDVNGKDGSPLLTCSLYASCHGAELATNTGGQTQPDGSVNFITDSDGYCKA